MQKTVSCGNSGSRRAWAGMAAILAACGCSTPSPLFEKPDTELVWPPNDPPARIAYVGMLRGEADVRPPAGVMHWLADTVFGVESPRGFGSPFGVAVSARGILCVADPEAGVVHVIDVASREYQVCTEAVEGKKFHTPIGVAFVGDEIAVADRGLGLVCIVAADGTPRRTIGGDELEAPVGIAVGPVTGTIYVTDVSAHTLTAFAPDGRVLFSAGRRGVGDGELNYPTFVACDADELVFVADSLNARIQVFDRDGHFVRCWGEKGDMPGSLAQPKGIAVDAHGVVYVVDARFENVQMFDREGRLLVAFGEEGEGPGQFWLPVGICVDGQGRIWVGDSFNHRVQVFRTLTPAGQGASR